MFLDRGGYTVHPVPAPFSTRALLRRRMRAGINSQYLILFIRGNVMSGEVIIRGVNQLPNPPIITGITRKKIIRKAWAVTRVLYSWSLPSKDPGCPSSVRMITLIVAPIIPDQIPNRKYIVPISLWFVDLPHRCIVMGQIDKP